ncbi:MAG: hypothetical protein RR619_04715 [Raoultibacter sp.]
MEYSSSSVYAAPISWVVGDIRSASFFGNPCLAHAKSKTNSWDVMHYDDLPKEVWNHELMGVNCKTPDSVFEFIRSFGFPFSPLRNNESCMSHSFEPPFFERTANVIGITDNMIENDYCGLVFKDRDEYDAACCPVISLSEASLTIRAFQIVVSNLSEAVKGNDYFRFANFVNAGACNAMIATDFNMESIDRRQDNLRSCGLLTSAICNQIVETLSDSALWRECACKGCQRVFKRKSGAKNPNAVSQYCCTECETRQRKRNQRAAAMNRIKH